VSPTHAMSSFVCMIHDDVGLYVAAGSVGHSYRMPLLSPLASIVLLHSISFIEQVCPTVRSGLNDTDRGRGKGQLLRLRMKEPPHCAAYALLPCSCLPHNALHSRSRIHIVPKYRLKLKKSHATCTYPIT